MFFMWRAVFVFMLGTLCGGLLLGTNTVAGEEPVVKLNETLFLGKPIQVDNVTLWPIYTTKPAEKVTDYLTLSGAQEQKLAEIRETGVQGGQGEQHPQGANIEGQVNQLVIENKGDKPILVLAGTLVKGGKQDRQIAQDFIIPPGKTVPVDAFCVEHGRWTANRENNDTKGRFGAQPVLAMKSVRNSAQFQADQGKVWEKVATENANAGVNTQTGTLMATIEDKDDKESQARREALRKNLEDGLAETAKADPAPVGFAYAVDGKIREARVFNHPLIFQRYSEQLVNTISIEADLAQRQALANKKEIYKETADVKRVVEMVRQVEKLNKERVNTKAGNINAYQKSAKVNGAATFPDAEAEAKNEPASQVWSVE